MNRISRFLSGGGLPAFGLLLLLFYEIGLVALLATPTAPTGLGAFADEFRIWCFGYSAAAGQVEWAYVMGMTGPPLLIGALFALFFWEPLRELLARPAALAGHALAAGAVVAVAAGGFALIGGASEPRQLAFPADSLRTSHRPPEIVLQAQSGETVDLAALRGKVVIVTGVYASCPHACPLILAQAKRAIAKLEPAEREDLRLIAVTLDPEHDTPQVLADLAQRHDLDAPLYNLVTGAPEEVERTLDQLGVARERDPSTGVIDHANLFVLVDREGRVAYRLTLGERQERWLVSALRVLLGERTDLG